MDPAAITALVVREVARDGNFGAHAHDVWRFAAQAAQQPLDDALKDSVWLWLAQHAAIHIDGDRAFASEDLQWLELTGNAKQGSVVPQLAFNVLCAVAHSREAGISTVDVAKQVGQDPRSLFGRVQLLADLGLVQRFPVIEKGSSTHRIVLTPYVSHHLQGQAAQPFVDKQAARKHIADFCKSGPQGLRLKRDVVAQVGSQLTANAQRRRPLVVSLLKDLELRGFVRCIQVYDPAQPSRAYACVQFVKDYDVGGQDRPSNSAWTDTSVDSGDGADADADADDAAAEDAESQAAAPDLGESLDLSRAVAGDAAEAGAERDSVQANIAMPLVNQIHDLVVAAGAQGISAMDLTRRLTGKSYSKAMGKYLDALTGGAKAKAPGTVQPPQLGHLSLIKGVDFAHRVKYYRYFTRTTYPGAAHDAQWGSFSPAKPVRDAALSLKILDAKSRLPLPGGCTIVETEDGELRPVFHGEKATGGKVVLVSDPSRVPGNAAAAAAPPKRRGRPPKNAPRPAPAPEPPKQAQPAAPPPLQSVSLAERHWQGGEARDREAGPAVWLRAAPHAAAADVAAAPASAASQPAPPNGGASHSSRASSPPAAPPVATAAAAAPAASDKSLGSLAFTRRLETLRSIVRENRGAVVGGQDLVDRFNAAVKGDSLVDRKTIDRVTKNLVKQGTLRQIFVNIPTMTGIHLMKYILYDPELVGNADESPLIAELKHELNDRTRTKQSMAAKAAAGSHRAGADDEPRQEMTVDQARAFRPLLGQRLATTATRATKPVSTRRFGASAAEVARGASANGEPKRAKRGRKPRRDAAPPPDKEDIQVPQHYGGAVAITPRPPQQSPAATARAGAGARPRSAAAVPAMEPDWLFRAATISRSLFPRGKNVDWALVAQNAPARVSEKSLKQQWSTLSTEFAGGAAEMAKRASDWEDMFAEAYASDAIVYLKPSDPGFTLQYYIDWWRVAEQSRSLSQAEAQARRQSQSRLRDLAFKSRQLDARLLDPLSSLQSQPSMIRAEELLVKTVLGVPLDTPPMKWKPSLKLSDNAAKLRAVIAADNGASFSAKEAIRELENVSEDDAKQALNELERNKYIQWAVSDPEKIPVGRPYVLSEKVMNMLAPPAKLERDLPARAAQALAGLAESELVDIPETVDEAQMIPLLEMATFGLDGKRVELQRSGEHSGRLTNHYRSRDIDKGEFDCDISARVGSGARDDASAAPPPRSAAVGAPQSRARSRAQQHPCIWGTSRLASTKIWNAVAFKLVATVLFRPGITYDALAQSVRHVLERDEVYEAVHALVANRALLDVDGGLKASPDWFAHVSSSPPSSPPSPPPSLPPTV